MNYGMLWFDNDPKTDLSDKIEEASAYYEKKYGQVPNQCFINPEMGADKHDAAKLMKVTKSPMILPNHLWIGVNTALKS